MTIAEAETKICNKVSRFWTDRALEMFRHLTISHTAHTTVSDLRVGKGWPATGTIHFTRDQDGARFALYMDGRQFRSRRTN